MRVTVIFALPDRQWCQSVDLEPGATVRHAIEVSGLCELVPELQGQAIEAGIFHRRCSQDALLRDGDRVEIYRPLLIDPKDARRLRARGKRVRGV